MDAPLNHKNASDPRTVRIALVMYQVGSKKSERTIIVNPGGPGGSGTLKAFMSGEQLSRDFSEGTMDVLGFDPRGVNMSAPALTCSQSDAYTDRYQQLVTQSPDGSDALKIARLSDAYNQAVWSACEEQHGDLLRYLNTPFVARDMDLIRHHLGEEELTAYGVSYGSALMQTYGVLFPERVGRVIIDGIVFPKFWQTLRGIMRGSLGHELDIWKQGLIGGCVRSGPKGCSLMPPGKNMTAAELEQRLDAFLEELKTHPLPATHPDLGPGIVTYETLVGSIFSSMYKITQWPAEADTLSDLIYRQNGTAALARQNYLYDPNKDFDGPSWRGIHSPRTKWKPLLNAVMCGDSFPIEENSESLSVQDFVNYYRTSTQKNPFSASFLFDLTLTCRTFPRHLSPIEVYRGNYTAKLKNPFLMISTTLDPITPIESARAAAAEWGPDNVKLVVHEGYGHGVTGHPSNCTFALVRDVLVRGQWPASAEMNCKADSTPFPHPE
ncbi:hypothetical protein OC846_005278 [Tilletia horrida]|uniref:AB hydrolase-1 domain-containing protein n=1 Tax=Tilletia horrida TaxID=155126 RepID=A0AAN6JQ30_9BASI|nr:hypothetical protein OC846_005278 [Tilletia horrida]KAK0562211.1 hypothetical protein OC861_005445 [Tilletia horrida]